MKKINADELVVRTIETIEVVTEVRNLDRVDSVDKFCGLLAKGHRKFYIVYGSHGSNGTISEVTFDGWPYESEYGIGLFIKTGNTSRSLRDMNVPTNSYNDHCLFATEEEANLYAEYVKESKK